MKIVFLKALARSYIKLGGHVVTAVPIKYAEKWVIVWRRRRPLWHILRLPWWVNNWFMVLAYLLRRRLGRMWKVWELFLPPSSSVLVVLFSFFHSSGRLRILGGGRVGAAVPLSRMKDSLDAPTRSSKAAAASKGPLRKCGREKSISFSGSVRHARRRR